jgi:hypothetical protein
MEAPVHLAGRRTQPLITPSVSSACATTHARKGFWDYFSQSSGDKGMMEQVQQQKVERELT